MMISLCLDFLLPFHPPDTNITIHVDILQKVVSSKKEWKKGNFVDELSSRTNIWMGNYFIEEFFSLFLLTNLFCWINLPRIYFAEELICWRIIQLENYFLSYKNTRQNKHYKWGEKNDLNAIAFNAEKIFVWMLEDKSINVLKTLKRKSFLIRHLIQYSTFCNVCIWEINVFVQIFVKYSSLCWFNILKWTLSDQSIKIKPSQH